MPADEPQRLAALYRLALLDTPASESYDRITRLAARVLDVPIMLVSLVDAGRQWFKSRVGLDVGQTPREISFCGHVVAARCPLIVPDATQDPRFAGNPLVTGAPFIRAYLGVPVFTVDRQPVGTLCAIDVVPRGFDEVEVATLRDLADILEDTMNARQLALQADAVLRYASGRERLFRENFEEAAAGMIHASPTGRVQRVNQRACELLGFSRGELHGISFMDLTHPEDAERHAAQMTRLTRNEVPGYRLLARLLTRDGGSRTVVLSVALSGDARAGGHHLIASFDAPASDCAAAS
jgi:diguanylate cyclase